MEKVTMLIKINNYEILNFESDTLLYTKSGITKINSLPISSLLEKLENLKTQTLSENNLFEIIEQYNIDPQEALSFLKNTNTIQSIKGNPHYSKATLYLDWKCTTDVQAAISELPKKNIILASMKNNDYPDNIAELFIISTLDLHPMKLREFYFEICKRNPDSAIILGYFIENKYHLSQPFIPTTGNPCAFCSIDKVRNTERVRPGISQWAKIVNFCSDRTLALPQPAPTLLQRSLILGLILKKIDLYTSPQDIPSTQDSNILTTTLDLETGEITNEIFPHWSMCHCLRIKQ